MLAGRTYDDSRRDTIEDAAALMSLVFSNNNNNSSSSNNNNTAVISPEDSRYAVQRDEVLRLRREWALARKQAVAVYRQHVTVGVGREGRGKRKRRKEEQSECKGEGEGECGLTAFSSSSSSSSSSRDACDRAIRTFDLEFSWPSLSPITSLQLALPSPFSNIPMSK